MLRLLKKEEKKSSVIGIVMILHMNSQECCMQNRNLI